VHYGETGSGREARSRENEGWVGGVGRAKESCRRARGAREGCGRGDRRVGCSGVCYVDRDWVV